MARTGAEPLGAMGSDTPIAVLSDRPRLLFDYFTQQFAQVTNPPLDSIREEVVTSLGSALGPEANLLAPGPEHARRVVLSFPVIDNDELAKIQHIDPSAGSATTTVVRGLYRVDDGPQALERRIAAMCAEVDEAIERGAQFIVLSDRDSTADLAPVPSLLMTAAVHHHLIRRENRMKVGLIVEAGDVREVHHIALLIGYGAAAVNPYLAMETSEQLVRTGRITGLTAEQAVRNVIKALGKGVLKIMSKMGISTVASYSGAQAFEAVGLSHALVEQYFTGTTTKLGGVGIDVIAAENAARHTAAYPDDPAASAHERLWVGGGLAGETAARPPAAPPAAGAAGARECGGGGGESAGRGGGPPPLSPPAPLSRPHPPPRNRRYDIFREYTRLVDEQAEELRTL